VVEVILTRKECTLQNQKNIMRDTNTKTTCATVNGKFKDKIINIALILSAIVGVGFFITHWDRQLTDATVFSAILVEIPIQVFIKRQKNAGI
jgi:hypothetical protein